MKKLSFFLALPVIALALPILTGCSATNKPSTFNVTNIDPLAAIPVSSLSEESNLRGLPRVHFLAVQDARDSQNLIEVGTKMVKPTGDPLPIAQKMLESGFRGAGYAVVVFDSPPIRTQITEWRLVVYPGFPTVRYEGFAEIGIELLDAAGKIVYKANYRSNVSGRTLYLNDESAGEYLARVMWGAINEAIKDYQLREKIIAYQPIIK
ncbi:MAG TPA: hypothetical protein PKD37_07300 [Oligoflexia bacterium]|nr:hypothetical protein [Oligoflexia bacterium]HMP27768.1 hypothetical protein [Oligoflexia bacterium]